MDLDIIVYHSVTLRQCLYAAGAFAGVYIVIKLFIKIFFSRSAPLEHSVVVTCSNCGWRGRIGQYVKRCPKCSQPVA